MNLIIFETLSLRQPKSQPAACCVYATYSHMAVLCCTHTWFLFFFLASHMRWVHSRAFVHWIKVAKIVSGDKISRLLFTAFENTSIGQMKTNNNKKVETHWKWCQLPALCAVSFFRRRRRRRINFRCIHNLRAHRIAATEFAYELNIHTFHMHTRRSTEWICFGFWRVI